jgi:hypothetical protein
MQKVAAIDDRCGAAQARVPRAHSMTEGNMNVIFSRFIMAVTLLSLAGVGCVSAAAKTPAGWRTYHSPDYGFTIAYPPSMTFYPGRPVKPPERSMFPVCAYSVACFEYTGDAFEGTDMQSVGVSVYVLRGVESEADCDKIDRVSGPTGTVKIHGTAFHYGDTDEVGLGSSIGVTSYRAFHQHVCFEVAIGIAGTDIGREDVEDGDYKLVDKRAMRQIFSDMDRMLHSFSFSGPVNDGPDWQAYHDDGCGQAFEYPAGAPIQKVVEFSSAAYNSHNIACEQAFAYHRRTYTIAVVVNLRNPDALDQWLSSSGYPTLAQLRVIAKNDRYSEYTDEIHTFLFSQASVFILSVSDENHKAISPQGDKVLAHFLRSLCLD